jgi:hypothetical protein
MWTEPIDVNPATRIKTLLSNGIFESPEAAFSFTPDYDSSRKDFWIKMLRTVKPPDPYSDRLDAMAMASVEQIKGLWEFRG